MIFKSSNVVSLIPDSKIHKRRMVCVVGLAWIVGLSSFMLFMQSPSYSTAQAFNGMHVISKTIIKKFVLALFPNIYLTLPFKFQYLRCCRCPWDRGLATPSFTFFFHASLSWGSTQKYTHREYHTFKLVGISKMRILFVFIEKHKVVKSTNQRPRG